MMCRWSRWLRLIDRYGFECKVSDCIPAGVVGRRDAPGYGRVSEEKEGGEGGEWRWW